jgi:hypothetical protein
MSQSDQDIGPAQPPQEAPAKPGIAGALVVAALLGAGAGLLLGYVWRLEAVVGVMLAGAIVALAIRLVILVSARRKGLARVEQEDGTLQ